MVISRHRLSTWARNSPYVCTSNTQARVVRAVHCAGTLSSFLSSLLLYTKYCRVDLLSFTLRVFWHFQNISMASLSTVIQGLLVAQLPEYEVFLLSHLLSPLSYSLSPSLVLPLVTLHSRPSFSLPITESILIQALDFQWCNRLFVQFLWEATTTSHVSLLRLFYYYKLHLSEYQTNIWWTHLNDIEIRHSTTLISRLQKSRHPSLLHFLANGQS